MIAYILAILSGLAFGIAIGLLMWVLLKIDARFIIQAEDDSGTRWES